MSSPLEEELYNNFIKYFQAVEYQDPEKHFDKLLQLMEKPILLAALKISQNNLSKCSKLLGISRTTLRKKIINLEISIS